MSLSIRQIVLVARQLKPVVDQLTQVLKLSVCYRDPGVAEFGLENALMLMGNAEQSQFLEVVAPTREGTAAGRHLARHGEGGYMLLLQTDDISRDRSRLEQLGVRIVWQACHPDISAMHLHPRDIGGAIVSLDQPSPAHSWRWAGPEWPTFADSSGAQEVLNVCISSPEPAITARRWATVLGIATPDQQGQHPSLQLSQGAVLFEPGETEMICGFELRISDVNAALTRARTLGLQVADNRVHMAGTVFTLSQV